MCATINRKEATIVETITAIWPPPSSPGLNISNPNSTFIFIILSFSRIEKRREKRSFVFFHILLSRKGASDVFYFLDFLSWYCWFFFLRRDSRGVIKDLFHAMNTNELSLTLFEGRGPFRGNIFFSNLGGNARLEISLSNIIHNHKISIQCIWLTYLL
jgi:hypothetical protein